MRILGGMFALAVISLSACQSDVGKDTQIAPVILSKVELSPCVLEQKSAVANAKLDTGRGLEALIDFLLQDTIKENHPTVCTKL